MRHKIQATLLAIAVLVIAPCFGQDKPNFSGTWKLNVSKSDFGEMPGPNSRTDVIEQRGADFKENVVSEGRNGTQQYTLAFTVGAKETTFPGDSGPQMGPVQLMKISASWQSSSLVVMESMKFQDADVAAKNTYSLSADGKALTISSDLNGPMGERTRKFVFDKQDSAVAAAAPSSTPATASAPGSSGPEGAKANLSGTWKLDTSKSSFGEMTTPDGLVDQIEDGGLSVKISSHWMGEPMGDTIVESELSTDGKETTSAFFFGSDATHTAHWEDGSLVVHTKAEMDEGDITIQDRYTLSADGKSLIQTSHYSGANGDSDMKLVFDKQP